MESLKILTLNGDELDANEVERYWDVKLVHHEGHTAELTVRARTISEARVKAETYRGFRAVEFRDRLSEEVF